VEGFVAGLHRSPYRGFSVEFAEHREYAPGDNIRYLDWKVFGRTDKFYLKQYEDETNLICYLLLDVSESMAYRGPDAALSKLEYGQCLAASLAWLVLQHQDAVGLVTFDRQIRDCIAPSNAATRLNDLISTMDIGTSAEKTAIGRVLQELAQQLTKRGIVVVISDLLDDLGNVLTGLRHLRHRQHDVAVFHLLDPSELHFPFEHNTLFRGLEGAPETIADPRVIRRAYLAEVNDFLKRIHRGCTDNAIDYRLISTDQPLDIALSTFLSSRSVRARSPR